MTQTTSVNMGARRSESPACPPHRTVVVATAVTADGGREILGLDAGDSEDEVFWRGFLRTRAFFTVSSCHLRPARRPGRRVGRVFQGGASTLGFGAVSLGRSELQQRRVQPGPAEELVSADQHRRHRLQLADCGQPFGDEQPATSWVTPSTSSQMCPGSGRDHRRCRCRRRLAAWSARRPPPAASVPGGRSPVHQPAQRGTAAGAAAFPESAGRFAEPVAMRLRRTGPTELEGRPVPSRVAAGGALRPSGGGHAPLVCGTRGNDETGTAPGGP